MRKTRPAHLLAGALLLLLALAPHGSACQQEGILYRLTADSAWLEGCIFGPCLCPVSQFDKVRGTFRLVELRTLHPGPQRLFEVRRFRGRLVRGDQKITIRGSGWYWTSAPVLDEQRLILDLELDGDPIERLDSGVVSGGSTFPSLAIDTRTPGQCFQSVLQLRAQPILPLPPPPCPDPDDPRVHYVADSNLDPAVCARVFFACGPEQEAFSNACGCGCIDEGA